MDETAILQIVKDISYPGAIVVVAFFLAKPIAPAIARWIDSKINKSPILDHDNEGNPITLQTIDDRLVNLAGNHFSELKDGLKDIEGAIERGNEISQRNQGEIKEAIAYIKAKINGKS